MGRFREFSDLSDAVDWESAADTAERFFLKKSWVMPGGEHLGACGRSKGAYTRTPVEAVPDGCYPQIRRHAPSPPARSEKNIPRSGHGYIRP